MITAESLQGTRTSNGVTPLLIRLPEAVLTSTEASLGTD